MIDKLLPCPCCGSEKIIKNVKKGDCGIATKSSYMRAFIKCGKCGLRTEVKKSTQAAIKLWNTRTTKENHETS